MAFYFRITAHHPQENIAIIADSNGRFEKLWRFSSYLLSKGFKIVEVSNEEHFSEGDFIKVPFEPYKIIIRACDKGTPISRPLTDLTKREIAVKGKVYQVFEGV